MSQFMQGNKKHQRRTQMQTQRMNMVQNMNVHKLQAEPGKAVQTGKQVHGKVHNSNSNGLNF